MNGPPALRRLPAQLTARRAWPHRGGLAVEARTASGTIVGVLITDNDTHLLAVHDPALPALVLALTTPGTELLGHRPGRRAVLRHADGHYVKVVRPGRTGPVTDGLRQAAARLAGQTGAPAIPRVCTADPAAGWVQLDDLPGPSLHELLRNDPDAAVELCTRVAPAMAALRAAPAAELPRHTHADEAAVLQRWLHDADSWSSGNHAALSDHVATVSERLLALTEPRWALCHRDLHDKQLIRIRPVRPGDPTVGLLDLDTLCAADPTLDQANLIAHLHLRVLQGHCTQETAARCARALHDPTLDPLALAAYTAATLLRLAAVYTFRPGPPDLPAQLAATTTPPPPK